MENTSGTVGVATPPEIRRLNWGAFFLGWIWCLAHGVWLGLILSIFLSGIGNFILLFKGNEWAWQARKWESAEAFNNSQRAWAIAGLILVGLGLVCGVIGAVTGLFAALLALLSGASTGEEGRLLLRLLM